MHLQHEPNAANGSHSSSLQAADSSPLGASGYQQYLRQQQQLLAPPHQQQQQDHHLPLDSWAGLMSQSTMNNLEDMLRASGASSGSSSGSRPRRSSPGNWDEDWEGPSISSDEENGRGRGRMLARLSEWLARRHKNKQRKLRQHLSEAEQLKVELELLHRADLQEQQQEQRDQTDHKDRHGGSWP